LVHEEETTMIEETRSWKRWRWLPVLFLFLLAGCVAAPTEMPQPTVVATAGITASPAATPLMPTPTYPPGYVPPPTPAPRPTLTATPLPTLTPTPYFPAEAAVPEGYPALPADLYFLRAGRLWRWPAAGEMLEAVAPPDGAVPVLGYWLANESGRIGYVIAGNLLYLYDPLTGRHQLIPTRGELDSLDRMGNGTRVPLQEYALTPDGRYLLYLGWGTAPGDAAGDAQSAAILAVDLEAPTHTIELASCLSDMSDWEQPLRCQGFSLSPGGTQIAFSDKSGLWLADVPGGSPRLLVERTEAIMPSRCDVNNPYALRWSPDGRWLLAWVGCYEGSYWTVVDIRTGRLIHFPESSWCYVGCRNDAHWGPAGIWMEQEYLYDVWDWRGELFLAEVAGGETLEVSRRITQTEAGPLRPISAYPFPDGRVGFAHRSCAGVAGPAPAIFVLEADGRLEEVARLPVVSCDLARGEGLLWGATRVSVLWSADGSAFLYLEGEEPVLLGRTDGSALWDVRQVLAGATNLQWGPGGQP
jgi:hypothetical protein